MSWEELFRYLRPAFRQGDHVAILGPTGTGKTHVALELAELRDHVVIVACKPKDELVTDALSKGYHLLPSSSLRDEVEYVDGRPRHRRLVFWPRLPKRVGKKAIPDHLYQKAERGHQREKVSGAIGYVRDVGHWALVLDEGTWVCRDLGLQQQVDQSLTQFRSLKASVIVLGQRPAWMGRYVLSQPTHLILFQTPNRDDLKSLGDISGTDTRVVQELVRTLDRDAHEFLYVDTRGHKMFRSVAPPR